MLQEIEENIDFYIVINMSLWYFLWCNQEILCINVHLSIAVGNKDDKNIDGMWYYKLQLLVFKICVYKFFYMLLLIKAFSKIDYIYLLRLVADRIWYTTDC